MVTVHIPPLVDDDPTTERQRERPHGPATTCAVAMPPHYGFDVDVARTRVTPALDAVYYRSHQRESAKEDAPAMVVIRARARDARERANDDDDGDVGGGDESDDRWDAWRGLGRGTHAFACDDGACDVQGDASARARATVETYVRERIFNAFAMGLRANERVRVRGDVEIFSPNRGTNVGFHRDGYVQGTYIAHALAREAKEASGATWFEHALPASANGKGRDVVVEDFEIDFQHQGRITSAVKAGNFVPVDARGGALVIFEDSAMLHRSPKRSAAALEAMSRVIARFNFSATRVSDGSTVRFEAPSSAVWQPFDDECCVRELDVDAETIDEYVKDW